MDLVEEIIQKYLDNSLTTAGLMDSYHQDMQGSRAVPLCIHPRDTMVMQY